MTTGKVGQPRAPTATIYPHTTTTIENDLNPYRNSSKSYRGLYNNNFENGLNNGSLSSSSSPPPVDGDLANIPTEDANNIVSNETVVIYQYGGMPRTGPNQETDWERERIRMEFYATYDVMTGVRIAGTLAGFFGLMVMLVMYKSRTNTLKALKDPTLAAVAAEMVQEEEERELQDAFDTLEAAGIFPELETLPYRERRLLSLGNISAPPTLNYSPRFSSVGGGSCSLWDPPTRPPYLMNAMSVSSRPLPFSPGSHSRRDAFRNSRNSSSDRSQCVSFDMSESTVRSMSRRRSDTRAWMGRRATFQSIQSDPLKNRNKIFLTNNRQGRDASRIKLIRLYTTSSSREEDVEEVIEQGLEEEALAQIQKAQSTSTASFIVSSVDYQDSDLRSVGSESMFSEQYADTDEEEDDEEKEREVSSDDSEEEGANGNEVARLKSGAYQKMKPKRTATHSRIATTYEASCSATTSGGSSSNRPKSLYESRTFELHSFVPKSSSASSTFGRGGDNLTAIVDSREMVQQLMRKEQQQKHQQEQKLCLPGTSTASKWSKETLF